MLRRVVGYKLTGFTSRKACWFVNCNNVNIFIFLRVIIFCHALSRLVLFTANGFHNFSNARSKLRRGKHLYNSFPIETYPIQWDTLLLLLSSFSFECGIKIAQIKTGGTGTKWDLSGTPMILVCWVKTLNTMHKSHAVLVASKDIGLEVHVEKSKYHTHMSSSERRTKCQYKGTW
jgi:hypothetical protein